MWDSCILTAVFFFLSSLCPCLNQPSLYRSQPLTHPQTAFCSGVNFQLRRRHLHADSSTRTTRMSVVAHQQHKSKFFRCSRCFREYSSLSSLNRHIRLECGVAKMFGCQFCGKYYTRRQTLQRHACSTKNMWNISIKKTNKTFLWSSNRSTHSFRWVSAFDICIFILYNMWACSSYIHTIPPSLSHLSCHKHISLNSVLSSNPSCLTHFICFLLYPNLSPRPPPTAQILIPQSVSFPATDDDDDDDQDNHNAIYVESADPIDDDLIICEESQNKHSISDPSSFSWTNDHLLIVNESDLVLCSTDPTTNDKTPHIRYEIQQLMPASNNLNTSTSSSSYSNHTLLPMLHHSAQHKTSTLHQPASLKKLPLNHQLVHIVQQPAVQPQQTHQFMTHSLTAKDDGLDDSDDPDSKAAVAAAAIAPITVGEQQRFVCPRCGKDYSQSKNMRRHYRLECGQEPKFPCPYCQLRFKRNNQLRNHIVSRHCVSSAGGTVSVDVTDKDVKQHLQLMKRE